MFKKLTDKKIADIFNISERNLHQTYKNPKPTTLKKNLTDTEIKKKQEQYMIIRLGSTCLEYDISEEELLITISFLKNIEQELKVKNKIK
ncbi:hypothetical protein [Malaciobacter mytili]|nr:hypothetical protein [Malaciobacter mytili]